MFGIETEYGLCIEGRGAAEQIDDAAAFVSHCPVRSFSGWDYAFESPRSDLRGFTVERLLHDPIDAEFDLGTTRTFDRDTHADRVLVNGARFYNDHGHPEYATPECARLLDLVAHDCAGELIMRRCAAEYERQTGRRVTLYKNNTDFHGASYGTHESYLFPRAVDTDLLINGLVPLLVVRPILVGAGKVGSEAGSDCQFQLSQRADFIKETANIETLYRRPLFNTRDEPHADPARFRRVHVISGDANRIQWSTAMKVGMTKLALQLIEIAEAPKWRIANVPRACESVSKDASFAWRLELEGRSWTTGLAVLESYLSASQTHFRGQNAETDWVLDEWQSAISDAQVDPGRLSDRVDWAAKLTMLKEFAEDQPWRIQTMQSLDLQYHNLDPEASLFEAWKSLGRCVELVDPERVEDAVCTPPHGTRAAQRAAIVAEKDEDLLAIGWRRAVFRDRIFEFDL